MESKFACKDTTLLISCYKSFIEKIKNKRYLQRTPAIPFGIRLRQIMAR